MKIAYTVTCFALGVVAILIGALMKIMHWVGADLLQLAGMALALIGSLLLLSRLFRSPESAKPNSPHQ